MATVTANLWKAVPATRHEWHYIQHKNCFFNFDKTVLRVKMYQYMLSTDQEKGKCAHYLAKWPTTLTVPLLVAPTRATYIVRHNSKTRHIRESVDFLCGVGANTPILSVHMLTFML